MRSNQVFSGALALLFAGLLPSTAGAQVVMHGAERCGVLRGPGQFGPYDYRYALPAQISIVEGAHFGPLSEALVTAMITRNKFAGDFDYTLRAFPNHPRALIAMSRVSQRERTDKPYGAQWSVDCYFARGMAFQPDDHMVPLIYANHLRDTNRKPEAKRYLKKVEAMVSRDPNPLTLVNLALQYLELGEVSEAQRLADWAAEIGPRDERLQAAIDAKAANPRPN